MPLHPEIAKLLADPAAPTTDRSIPWPCAPRESCRPRGARPCSGRGRLGHTAVGDVPVRIYTPVEADGLRTPRLLPRRRVLPRQPRHSRPCRPVPGERNRVRSSPSAIGCAPRAASRQDSTTATPSCAGPPSTATASAGTTDPGRRRRQLRRRLRRRPRGPGPRRRARPHHPPGSLLPVARPRLRPRSLSVPARERRGLRPRDRRPEAVQLLLRELRRRPGRPARLADQARRSHRAPARRSSSPPSTTRCVTRPSSTADDSRRPGSPRPCSRYAGARHGFVQHFSWIPEYAPARSPRVHEEVRAAMTRCRSTPWPPRGAGSASTATSSMPPSPRSSTPASPRRPPTAWRPRSRSSAAASRTCAGSC